MVLVGVADSGFVNSKRQSKAKATALIRVTDYRYFTAHQLDQFLTNH